MVQNFLKVSRMSMESKLHREGSADRDASLVSKTLSSLRSKWPNAPVVLTTVQP